MSDLDIETCPICGATGACAYDDQGRALVHSEVFPNRPEGQ
jgi:hypothetical protein